MTTVNHPAVPWVTCQQVGPEHFVCRCTVCGQQTGQASRAEGADHFAELHSAHESASSTHFGLGDFIAKLTGKVGLKPCSACERRRRQLNGLAPRVFRR